MRGILVAALLLTTVLLGVAATANAQDDPNRPCSWYYYSEAWASWGFVFVAENDPMGFTSTCLQDLEMTAACLPNCGAL